MQRSLTAELGRVEDWSERTVLDCQPPSALAGAAVRHHLLTHRRYALVEAAQMVALKLTGEAVFLGHAPLVLTMSEQDAVVRMRVGGITTSWRRTPPSSVRGSAQVGLTTLRWGVNCEADVVTGLWATLDASRHPRVLRDAADKIEFGYALSAQVGASRA